jgi:predicted dehydrogenase
MPTKKLNRRSFLAGTSKMALGSAVIPMFVPSSVLGKNPPSGRLNIACIGMGGRMSRHVGNLAARKQNIVAVCDVDASRTARHKKAKAYKDYRKLLESEKSLDAVVVSTPDHWHAKICTAAIKAGKHVFCEKPLTHTVAEARALGELARKSSVVTQTGNQGSASTNFRRSIELIQAGVLGQIKEIHIWHPQHGWPSGIDRPAGQDKLPSGLDWDFWIGPSPMRPYKDKIYHPAKWRGWYDFGGGSIADFCCHSFSMPVKALDLGHPERIEVSGKGLGKESFATSCTLKFHFPAKGKRGPVIINFYTGGDMPPPAAMAGVKETFNRINRTGALVIGEKGTIQAGLWNNQCFLKMKDDKKFLGGLKHPAGKDVPLSLPRSRGHVEEWLDACKAAGNVKTFSPFEFGSHVTEIGCTGVVALRLQRDIEWDGKAMKVKGAPEADALINPKPRKGWG